MFAKLGGEELSWLSIIYSQSNVTNSTFVHNIHGWRQSLFSAIFVLIWKRSHFSRCLVSASLPVCICVNTSQLAIGTVNDVESYPHRMLKLYFTKILSMFPLQRMFSNIQIYSTNCLRSAICLIDTCGPCPRSE